MTRRQRSTWTGRAVVVAWIALVWMLLWGDATAGNVVAALGVGVLVAALLPVPASPGDVPHHTVRPWPLVRWLVHLAGSLVAATVDVTRQVLRPGRAHIREAIVAVPIAGVSHRLVALVANQVTLTPGTLVIDYDPERRVLFVHTLVLHDAAALRADVRRFEELTVRAFAARDAQALAAERWAEIDGSGTWTS